MDKTTLLIGIALLAIGLIAVATVIGLKTTLAFGGLFSMLFGLVTICVTLMDYWE